MSYKELRIYLDAQIEANNLFSKHEALSILVIAEKKLKKSQQNSIGRYAQLIRIELESQLYNEEISAFLSELIRPFNTKRGRVLTER